MLKSVTIVLLLPALLVGIVGCAGSGISIPAKTPVANLASPAGDIPVAGAGSVSPRGLESGVTIQVDDPAFAEPFAAQLGRAYQSALGLPCYRLTATSVASAGEPLALCQRADGRWVVAPRVFTAAPTGDSSQ